MTKSEINLLPQDAQRRRAYLALLGGMSRFLRRVYLSLAVLAIALVLILAGVLSIQEIVVDRHGETVDRSMEKNASSINALTTYMEQRIGFYESWSVRTAEILQQMPAEVSVTSLKKEEDTNKIEIAGTANQRGAIKIFREKLEALSWVEKVEAPLQNYALGDVAQYSFSLITKTDEAVP